MNRFLLIGSLVMLSAGLSDGRSQAKSLAGVVMPDSVQLRGETLKLNGMGLRTFTFLKVHGFVAGLYLSRLAHDAQTILAAPGLKLVKIEILHSAGVGLMKDQFEDGRARNCVQGCPKSEDASFAQLLATARPVKPGDSTTYIYGPEGLTVLFDDQLVTVIRDPEFALRMLEGMVGAHPPTEALRDGLLGF